MSTRQHPSLAHKLFNAHAGELVAAALAAAYFFCPLAAYFCLRPLREAMGVQRSFDDLRWLFIGTLVTMIFANAGYAWLTSRVTRRVFIPVTYAFFLLNLLGFALILWRAPDAIGVRVGWVFYIWLSVFNLFVVSVFWSFMADLFALEQSKRLYPVIAVGGTLGAVAGSWYARHAAESVGPVGLMLTAAALLTLAIVIFAVLERRRAPNERNALRTADDRDPADEPLRGSALAGITHVARSPYLLGVCLYIALLAIGGTLLYYTQAKIVVETTDDHRERIQLFANIDLWTQLLTLFLQAFVTGRLLRRLGVGVLLAVLPAVLTLGFALLAVWPAYGALLIVQALFRSAKHAIARPARETLFTVVPREDKYKAKNLLDTFVFRAGDVAGSGADWALRAFGIGMAGVAVATIPVAAGWMALAFFLASAQMALAKRELEHDAAPTQPTPITG